MTWLGAIPWRAIRLAGRYKVPSHESAKRTRRQGTDRAPPRPESTTKELDDYQNP